MSFIVAPLYTADGKVLVTTVRILPYKDMPQAILWGDRLFVKRADLENKYCEGYCHVVPNDTDPPEPWDSDGNGQCGPDDDETKRLR